MEEARKEVLSNLASRSSDRSSDRLASGNSGDNGDELAENAAWEFEPEPESDETGEPEPQ